MAIASRVAGVKEGLGTLHPADVMLRALRTFIRDFSSRSCVASSQVGKFFLMCCMNFFRDVVL